MKAIEAFAAFWYSRGERCLSGVSCAGSEGLDLAPSGARTGGHFQGSAGARHTMGGANRAESRRIGIANNYCAGFLRQQENQQLGIPREMAASFPPELQRLVGYSVFRGLIGHIDKRDPIELLGASGEFRSIWDR